MRLGLRCLQIDLARQKESVEFVKSYTDFAIKYGYNALVLYLENAIRTKSTSYFNESETYSEEEIKEIIAYAESKGLEVIPALENLGHLEKFFMYPQLEELSEIEDYTKEGRGFDAYKRGACGCVTNPKLNQFMDNYIREVCALFHSKYVHMGLDEPFDLAVCPRCKAELAKGIAKAEVFLKQVLHTYELCKSMGKTMMMWDDFFEYADVVAQLPRDIILCNWNYVFIGDEPQGHWTNRIKKDWFRLYDELGFSYIFCCYAHRASSSYNVDTFTAYAEKYHPVGAMMTTWKRSDSFYQGAYPCIAYAGKKWSGQIYGESDKKSVYAEVLGEDTEAAELISSLHIVENGSNFRIADFCENDYMLKLMYRDLLAYILPKLKSYAKVAQGQAKDILTDIYDYVKEIELKLRLQYLGVELFDAYEAGGKEASYFLEKLSIIRTEFAEIETNAKALWQKYRFGIQSYLNQFENKHSGYIEKLDKLDQSLQTLKRHGVLYVELMLHDPYPTVRNRIIVKYEGEEEEILYEGSLKPTTALFEWGGCYAYRFALKNRKVEYVRLQTFGEGSIGVVHFRYTVNGKKYVAKEVAAVSGIVMNAENVLYNDTRFAEVGLNDGIAHFNNIDFSKEIHEVCVRFKALK